MHATVFAYGRTGSGKTYTMQGTPEIPGLVKLAAGEIYATKPTDDIIRVSFIEIYNECVYDLMRKEANIFARPVCRFERTKRERYMLQTCRFSQPLPWTIFGTLRESLRKQRRWCDERKCAMVSLPLCYRS